MIVDPKKVKTGELHALMLGSIAPRPIALASTVDEQGNPNLSPFSFYNTFGSKPPILVFSPARRVRDNTIKHTLENARSIGEVVVGAVSYGMVNQVSLASCEYPKGVNEFVKSGLNADPAQYVKPFLIRESPVNFECKVLNIVETGTEGGAGNLIICEIVCMHIKDEVLNADGKIDPHKIDLVARMGGDYYCRASGSAVFTVPKPNLKLGIGFDQIPSEIRNSEVLSGNDLAQLANTESLPTADAIQQFHKSDDMKKFNEALEADPAHKILAKHLAARKLIHAGKINEAWMLLLG
jgi:flavin reductase (DIM6/NTAB) family NADH-FMN oxidoreductase RutF